MKDAVKVLVDVFDHRAKGICVGFGHEVERPSEKVLRAVSDEELEVRGHVPLDAVLCSIDLVAVDPDPLRDDILRFHLMFIGQAVALTNELPEVTVQRFVGEMDLRFVAWIDEVEPALRVMFLPLLDGLLGEHCIVRDLEGIGATLLFRALKLPFFRKFDPWIALGAGRSSSVAGHYEYGCCEEHSDKSLRTSM